MVALALARCYANPEMETNPTGCGTSAAGAAKAWDFGRRNPELWGCAQICSAGSEHKVEIRDAEMRIEKIKFPSSPDPS